MHNDLIARILAPTRMSQREIHVLTEFESKKLLASVGIPVTKGRIVSDEEEAVRVAKEVGLPVALKLTSPQLVHKSDTGGVRLNVMTTKEVKVVYRDLVSSAKNIDVQGVYVQNFIPSGVEVIVGSKRDQTFGPVVVFGLGGVFVEVLKDVAMRVVPFSEQEARKMVAETKGHALLEGYRGRRADVGALVDIIMKLQNLLAQRTDLLEVDMNPIKVLGAGEGAVVLDARITIS